MNEPTLIAKAEVTALGRLREDGIICEYPDCENWITEMMFVLIVADGTQVRLWCDDHADIE